MPNWKCMSNRALNVFPNLSLFHETAITRSNLSNLQVYFEGAPIFI